MHRTRHGLEAKYVVIDGENPEAYDALRENLVQSYRPANAAEEILVDEIAQCFWRLQRARAIEAATFNLACGGSDPAIGFSGSPERFDHLRRYMTSIERAYHRAIQQLERTQSIRAKQERDRPRTEEPVGFVSQNPPPRLIRMTNYERNKLEGNLELPKEGSVVYHGRRSNELPFTKIAPVAELSNDTTAWDRSTQ